MTDTLAPGPADADIDRLRSRLERERRARRQAEMIAERGMRELWESNRDLQDRVAERTAQLQRVTNALEFAQIARMRAIGELVDDLGDELDGAGVDIGQHRDLAETIEQMRSLTESARNPEDMACASCGAVQLADQLVERWQRSAARRGKLLTVEEGESTVAEVRRWQQMLAVADTLIAAVVRLDGGGSAAVVVTARSSVAELRVGGSVLASALSDASDGDLEAPAASSARAEVLLASRIAATVGGELRITMVDGALGVVVELPQAN